MSYGFLFSEDAEHLYSYARSLDKLLKDVMTLEMPDVAEADELRHVVKDMSPQIANSEPTQVADSAPKAERKVNGLTKREYMRLYMQKRRAKLKEQAGG